MRPAPLRDTTPAGSAAAPDDAEQDLLRESARALADAHDLLGRSRSRASRLDALKAQAVSEQEKLIEVQGRRIQSLEHQLSDLQAFGSNQAAALDEAIELVTDLEHRMDLLERVNAELRARLAKLQSGRDVPARRSLEQASLENDLALIRTFGTGDDLTRFTDFVRSAAA